MDENQETPFEHEAFLRLFTRYDTAHIVDLGTTFGVSVGDDGTTDVCVFEGEVSVSSSTVQLRLPHPCRRSRSSSPTGVILAHGGNRDGYSVYLDEGHLCFATCANKKRTVVRSAAAISGPTHFEANWNPNGEMFLKVNNKLVGKDQSGIFQHEPGDSIQIGADLVQPVGNYETPNHFSRCIENLTFKYPNGT